MPVSANISCVAETHDGRLVVTGHIGKDAAGHLWSTDPTWQWLGRLECRSFGDFNCTHLLISSDDSVLYTSTDCGRFLAYDLSRRQPQCIEDGGGGGPLASVARTDQ